MGTHSEALGNKIIKKHKQVIGEVRATWAQYLVQMKNVFSAQNTAHKRLPLHCPQHEYRMVTKSGGEKSECPQAINSVLAINLVYCEMSDSWYIYRISHCLNVCIWYVDFCCRRSNIR